MQEPGAPLDDRPLTEMVTEALSRHGIEAVVVQKDNGIEMYGPNGEPIFIDAAHDIAAWTTLPAAMRQRKAHALATRLAHIFHSGTGKKESPLSQFPPLSRLFPLGIGLGIGIVVFVGLRLTREEPKPPPPEGMPSESEQQRNIRLSRACEATRTMFWKGGNWGSMPLEGWVVELWLGRKGPSFMTDPAVTNLLENGKISPKAEGSLAEIGDGKASLEESAASPAVSGVKLVLREGYGRSFFEIQSRDRFVSLGEKLIRETKADYAGLWARCGHQTTREVGAWFYGRNAKNAATALLYSMGRPNGPTVAQHVAVAPDFGALTALTERLDEAGFLTIVQSDGARVSTAEGVSVVFPFDPQTRAGQSSKRLAEKL